jgi:hypothetical protein
METGMLLESVFNNDSNNNYTKMFLQQLQMTRRIAVVAF